MHVIDSDQNETFPFPKKTFNPIDVRNPVFLIYKNIHFVDFFEWLLPVILGTGIMLIAFYLKYRRKASLEKNLKQFYKSFALGEINKSDLDELKRDLFFFEKTSQQNSDRNLIKNTTANYYGGERYGMDS